MTDYKFSLTSQCHKTTILHIMLFKIKSYLAWKAIIQQPVNADSCSIGVNTARSGVDPTVHTVDYRPH